MIVSFRCKDTEAIFNDERCPRFASIEKVARRRLLMLDAATTLRDLGRVPGNHLEALKKERAGQHSIRINDQWRVCFEWTKGGPARVEITDYH
jgi:proteic killer suppression protein